MSRSLALLVVLLLPAVASAEDAAPAAPTAPARTAEVETPPAPAAPNPATARGDDDAPEPQREVNRHEDASNDRGFLAPHAETLPEGSWSVNSYELFLVGATYAPTDHVQVTAMTLVPVTSDFPLSLLMQAKVVLLRKPDFTLSARANAVVVTIDGEGGGLFGGGLMFDYHLPSSPRLGIHAGVSVNGIFGNTDEGFDVAEGTGLTGELGVFYRAGENLKIGVEAVAPSAYADGDFEFAPITLVTYGVRFHGKGLAADLAFIRPFGDGDLSEELVMGLPYVAFSARF